MWEDAAARKGPAPDTKEGVAEEARWIRDTAVIVLDTAEGVHAVKAMVER